jgi:hypothetical protein
MEAVPGDTAVETTAQAFSRLQKWAWSHSQVSNARCRMVWVTSCTDLRLPQLLSWRDASSAPAVRSLAAAQRSLRLPIILVKPGQSGQICGAPRGHNPAVEVNE